MTRVVFSDGGRENLSYFLCDLFVVVGSQKKKNPPVFTFHRLPRGKIVRDAAENAKEKGK